MKTFRPAPKDTHNRRRVSRLVRWIEQVRDILFLLIEVSTDVLLKLIQSASAVYAALASALIIWIDHMTELVYPLCNWKVLLVLATIGLLLHVSVTQIPSFQFSSLGYMARFVKGLLLHHP